VSTPRYARSEGPERYRIDDGSLSREGRFSMRTFDAGGALDERKFSAIRGALEAHGAVHVRRTGLRCEHAGALPDWALEGLGFGGPSAFAWGGTSSGRTTRRALSRELRATDEYPPHLWLLPHNEVLYQRRLPAHLLFFSAHACPPAQGGRTFVHSAHEFESALISQGEDGVHLARTLREKGLLIEMGFLDARHPEKEQNYFRSWQDRFETDSRELARERCQTATHQFDECWWVEEPVANGPACWTLMTRVRIPAFHRDPASGREHLFFPRVALDPPSLRNGHRRYPLGDGRAFTDDEIDLLLSAFVRTREGVHYEAGDLLLVDNLRYGHSRESFDGPRTLGVAMAGSFSTEHMELAPR
jgi:hypothetical protein